MDQPPPTIDAPGRSLLIGASAGGVLRLLQVALSALLVFTLTRSLPLKEYGVWASLAVVGTLATIIFGVGARLCNELAAGGAPRGEEDRRRLFLAVFSVCARGCWAAGGLLLVLSPLVPWRAVLGQADPSLFPLARRGFLAALLLQAAGMPFALGSFGMRAFRRHVAVAMLSPAAAAASLCLALLFLHHPWRLPLLLAPFVAWNLVFLASFVLFLKSRRWRWRFMPLAHSWPLFRPLLADSVSFSLLGLALGFLLQSLTFLTSRRLGYTAAAGLDVYVKVYAVALIGLTEILQPLWPEYLRCRSAGDGPGIRRRLRSSLAVTAALSVAAGAGGLVAAPLLVRAVTGRAIDLPRSTLALLGAWLLCGALIQALQMFLNACNATRAQTLAAIALLLALPLASDGFSASWGRNGILLAAILCLGLLLLVMMWRARVELARLGPGSGRAAPVAGRAGGEEKKHALREPLRP